MKKPKVHVIYEYGVDMRPHASAYLRLIRPLSYPQIQQKLNVTFSRNPPDMDTDLVVLDRLWRPDIDPKKVMDLVAAVRQLKAKLIYCFDDNFLEAGARVKWIRSQQIKSFEILLEESDGLIVTTKALQKTFGQKHPTTLVIPNALDERLIVQKGQAIGLRYPKIVIGYMGTRTHDADLAMVAPALQAVNQKFPGKLQFQFIGTLDEKKQKEIDALSGLPIEILHILPEEVEYPAFMVWFTGSTNWDIAIAPLIDDSFNECKSDIKHLDYAATRAPGVYSAVAAYKSTVQHGKTGLLVENTTEAWTAALCEMIENQTLRRELSGNASNYLYTERILRTCARNWVETLYELS